MRTWPTTCTACRAPFDAGFFVVSDQEIRLCPRCEELYRSDRYLSTLEEALQAAQREVATCELAIAEHKAAHPPLVKVGQGEYRKENDGWPPCTSR